MKLNIELLGSSFYYTINRVSLKLFEVLSLWILVLLLPKEDIGLIGITVGFISILNILNISPYRRIYKSYEEIKPRMNDHVSGYIAFWFLKSVIMFIIAIIVGIFYVNSGYQSELFLVLTGLVLAYLFSNVQLLLQEVFFVNLKQKIVTYFNVASMIIFLFSLGLLLLIPSVEVYVGLIGLKAVITALGFFFLAGKELRFFFKLSKDWKKLVKDALAEFAVADHLIGASIELVNKVFLFVLAFFVVQTIVGEYTIALSLVNFLTFFPLIIYRTTMLAITRVSSKEGLEKVLSAFTKYAIVFSIIQFVIFVIALDPIINFVTSGNTGGIWNYAFLLGLGVTVFSAGHPIHAMALLRGNIEYYFKKIVLPITIASIVGYFIVSAYFQPEAVGVVFVGASILLNVLAYIHVKNNTGVRIQKTFIFPEEKEAIDHVLKKIGIKGKA